MPAKPMYQGSARSIIQALKSYPEEFLDRHAIERFLGLKKRRALEVMAGLGTRVVFGHVAVVPKENVILYLEGVAANDPANEAERRQRFAVRLNEMAERRLKEPPLYVEVPTAMLKQWERQGLDNLPEGVTLQSGRVIVEFSDGKDALQKFAELATVIACNLNAFLLRTDPDAARIIPLGGNAGSIESGAA